MWVAGRLPGVGRHLNRCRMFASARAQGPLEITGNP
jgi:hypothetical protein